MTNAQLCLTIGMPTLAVLVGILVNAMQFSALSARLTTVETSLGARMNTLETSLNARMASLETRMDLLMGKVIDIDNRLIRLER